MCVIKCMNSKSVNACVCACVCNHACMRVFGGGGGGMCVDIIDKKANSHTLNRE